MTPSLTGCICKAKQGGDQPQTKKRDLVVISREKRCIVFYQCWIVANPSESLTLPQPFIFLLRLCA